jgi:hypothetical protein
VQAPPVNGQPAEQAFYGLAQPIVGARILLADRQLLRESMTPVALLALVCALYATVGANPAAGRWSWFGCFYKAFAALAPLPSLLFANHYARLGAMIRWRAGLGACGPREMPVGMLIGRMVRQALLVAIGVVPFVIPVSLLPGVGHVLTGIVAGIWSVHWIVADAFDDAQVLLPGETLRESVARDRNAPPPWFVRVLNAAAARLPVIGRPLRAFARLCDKLAMDSRGEIATMERNRFIVLGFGISTAALLATPVLNLLFRPIILAGSSHLLGQLDKHELSPEPARAPAQLR